MECLHENTRWLHDTQNECDEAGCDVEFDVCGLFICVDCGEEVI
jgi:hypothetical protein